MLNKKIFKIGLVSLSAVVLIALSYEGYTYFSSKASITTGKVSANSVVQPSNKPVDKDLNEDKDKPNDDVKEKAKTPPQSKDSYDIEKLKSDLSSKEKDGKKIAFLTFDDGPSTTVTPKILDVLKTNDIKATFFLLGENVDKNEKSKDLVKEIFNSGHAIGNHTYSHDLKKLYPKNKLDVDHYMSEVDHCNTSIREALGQDYTTRVLRMPGGYMSRKYYKDPNLDTFAAKLTENNMWQIDWNAYDEDAEGKRKNANQLLEAVKKSVGTKEKIVLLMHDTYGKEETAKALPQIIEYLKSQGYEFKSMV